MGAFDLHSVVVDGPPCVGEARRTAAGAALALGFTPRAVEEAAIVATELATNLARHTTAGGVLHVQHALQNGRPGLELVAADSGPGITHLDRALTDGFSTRGSQGVGLGAVRRLSDEFDIHSCVAGARPGGAADAHRGGTVVLSRKWRAAAPGLAGSPRDPFEVAVFSRPLPGEEQNGDLAVVHQDGDRLLVGVFDALGHGPGARATSLAAAHYIDLHAAAPLDDLVRGLHRALADTRGGVVGLARIDAAAGTLSYCGVGNVEARVLRAPTPVRPISFPGTVGARLPTLQVQQYGWSPGAVLVVASDGVSTRWDPARYPGIERHHPSVLGATLFRDFARATDDASVVVARWLGR